jgi:capsular polysaccharide transport system ATP-binding protein
MITLKHVSKSYPVRNGRHTVLNDISIEFPSDKSVGILGVNGAGKSTLLRLLAGVETPDTGSVIRRGRISWPLGFSGGFNGSLTGEENCRFVSRIYDEDINRVTSFAYEFSELGKFFYMPVRTYSSGMRSRLAFGLSMAIDFDCYLVDEVTAVGDRHFNRKCKAAFEERRGKSTLLMVSHSMGTIRQYCDHFAVLNNGKLRMFDNLGVAERSYDG